MQKTDTQRSVPHMEMLTYLSNSEQSPSLLLIKRKSVCEELPRVPAQKSNDFLSFI